MESGVNFYPPKSLKDQGMIDVTKDIISIIRTMSFENKIRFLIVKQCCFSPEKIYEFLNLFRRRSCADNWFAASATNLLTTQ